MISRRAKTILIFFLVIIDVSSICLVIFSSIPISGSMSPTMNPGDLLFWHPVQSSTVQEGDVIAFDAKELWDNAPDIPVVHRVIKKSFFNGMWHYETKGDNNPDKDPALIPENRIIGVVWARIMGIGLIARIFLVIFFIVSLIFTFYFIFVKVDEDRESREDELNFTASLKKGEDEPEYTQLLEIQKYLGIKQEGEVLHVCINRAYESWFLKIKENIQEQEG